jgi:glycosyltransferase involved in cell wall biosynthesis
MKPTAPHLSIVVPVFNEVENLRPLVKAVRAALVEARDWELLLVDDGSTDGTRRLACHLARDDDRVRLVCLARNFGQTAAMQAGFDAARGDVVVSMDGDLQNDPADIPRLLAKLEEGYDLVAGYRVDRQDTLITRKVPSWVANRIIAWLTGVSIRDNGCSLKAYRRELFDRVVLYSDMHRFIPAMAVATAGARVAEIPVRHHARRAGSSKYGLSRIWKVLSDLLAIKMISSFRNRPLVMFGLGSAVAAVMAGVFFVLTLISVPGGLREGMAYTFVFPSIVLVWITLAVYLLLLGLIGEVVIRGDRLSRDVPLPVVREWS